MTILFLDQFDDLGGAQLCLLDFMPRLRRQGWEVHAALPGTGAFAARLQEYGVCIHVLPLRKYNAGFKTPLDVLRLMANLPALSEAIRGLAELIRPGLIYVNGPRLLPAVARARVNAPVVFHSHNRVTARNGRMLAQHAIWSTKATVFAASRFAAACWDRAHVVYGGVPGPAAEFVRRTPSVPRVTLAGRIEEPKRQREFVLAARELPDVEFCICGDVRAGDRKAERYKQDVIRLAPASVKFLGNRPSIYPVLQETALLVLPSAGEGGFPRVLMEAFAAGVPVLARNSGAVPEILVDGRNGFLLESADPVSMARRIRTILDQPARMEETAAHCRQLWRENFTAERYAEDIWRIVRKCVDIQ
jgi:glycosyltransferase involved in cell wall biosynthesis